MTMFREKQLRDIADKWNVEANTLVRKAKDHPQTLEAYEEINHALGMLKCSDELLQLIRTGENDGLNG